MKKKSEKKILELSHYNKWCKTIINFMLTKNPEAEILQTVIEIIDKGFSNQDLRGMRLLYNDINEWAKYLTQPELKELNEQLKVKFGEDLENNKSKDLLKVKKIIKKGIISNEVEYILVQNRVDDIYSNSENKSEVDILNNLLVKFHHVKTLPL